MARSQLAETAEQNQYYWYLWKGIFLYYVSSFILYITFIEWMSEWPHLGISMNEDVWYGWDMNHLIEFSLALGIMCEMYECRCKTQKPHKTSMEQNNLL